MSEEKPSLRIYISFLKEDGESAIPCVKLLKRTIKAGLKDRYNALFFHPDDVSVGEVIDETLNRRVSELEIAIVLVSNEYLFEEREAERVHAKHPHPIIAKLENIGPGASFTPFDRRDIVPGQSFIQAQDAGRTAEQDFANNVLGMIERELTNRQVYAHTSEPRLSPEAVAEELVARPLDSLTVKTIASRAKRWQLTPERNTSREKVIDPETSVNVNDVVEDLVSWARRSSDDRSSLCALLGDVGTGKTTTSILLTRTLLELRKAGERVPLPLYFDLRDLSPSGVTGFGLRTLLIHLLDGFTTSAITVDEVLDIIRKERTLVIFDGLDEVLVHLSPGDGKRLTRSLLEVLALSKPSSEGEVPRTRLLLSCRTQYFRTVEEEFAFFNGQARERGEGSLVLTLLPFNEDQIREYLRRNVPDSNPVQLLDLIRSVHNLGELASQPVLLDMILQFLPDIEGTARAGRRIRSVDLYERFIDQWLERDDGKHNFVPRHKIQLMSHLASQVWRSGSRTWKADEMEDWLLEFCEEHKNIMRRSSHYTPDQLTNDFLTATFLSRRGDNFAFAHSSLLEYFLAKRLVDSLLADSEDDALAGWDINQPTEEAYTFFDELIERLPVPTQRKALARLEQVGQHGTVTARTNVFAYTLRALKRGYPHPRPRALNLSDTDLRSWTIGAKRTHVDLSGVPLAGARLDDAHIQHTRFDHADAARTSMQRTLFEHCSLTNTDLAAANLAGTIFRHCVLNGVSLDEARRYRTQLLHTTGYHQQLSKLFTAPLTGHDSLRVLPEAQVFGGHSVDVTAVAWSPNGTHILTASSKVTRVWDAATGENTLTLNHKDNINTVAWSPNGTHILTGSDDSTARVWDATTGDNTLTLRQTGPVNAVAWSPDGTHILTASDGTRVWDATTGENTLTLTHTEWVWDATWSPDGTHILTASDRTARVWDATTGDNTLTLTHTEWVWDATWSPDGTHILTASQDGTVRVWEAATGDNTLTLNHTDWVRAVAWSPDSTHILTGSQDGTARIWDATTGEQVRFFITALPGGECAVLTPDQTRVIGASPYAWRWLGRYAVHPDGTLERIPVEIDGPLPPLGAGSQAD